MNKSDYRFDFITLGLSIFAAVVWSVIGDLLIYGLLAKDVARPIITASYFLGLGVLLIGIIYLSVIIMHYRPPQKNQLLHSLLALLVVIALAAGFEAIYDMNITSTVNKKGATSYILMIDDTGTMADNDPTGNIRNNAIAEALKGVKSSLPVYVYKFSDDATLLTSSAERAGNINTNFIWNNIGQTYFVPSLNTVLTDLESGRLSEAGSRPTILFMSDGEPMDNLILDTDNYTVIGSNEDYYNNAMALIALRANNIGVKINTVGLGIGQNSQGAAYLENISDMTEGQSVMANGVGDLIEAFTEVLKTVMPKGQMLLTQRTSEKYGGLLAAERLIFLVVLGAVFFFIKSELVRTASGAEHNSNSMGIIMVVVYALVLLIGAVGIEVAMSMFGWNAHAARGLLCLSFLMVLTFTGRNAKDPTRTQMSGMTFGDQQGFNPNGSNSQQDSGILGWNIDENAQAGRGGYNPTHNGDSAWSNQGTNEWTTNGGFQNTDQWGNQYGGFNANSGSNGWGGNSNFGGGSNGGWG